MKIVKFVAAGLIIAGLGAFATAAREQTATPYQSLIQPGQGPVILAASNACKKACAAQFRSCKGLCVAQKTGHSCIDGCKSTFQSCKAGC